MALLSQVNALCLNSESTLLATCGNDRKVTTWNLPHCSKAKELSLDGWVRIGRLYGWNQLPALPSSYPQLLVSRTQPTATHL